jgi:hypothetical protein
VVARIEAAAAAGHRISGWLSIQHAFRAELLVALSRRQVDAN